MLQISEMRNCNQAIYFEARKKKDLYLWLSTVPRGPCAKFLVHNVHTMSELKLTGNCLRGSRPVMVFDKGMDERPELRVVKELFAQVTFVCVLSLFSV